MSVSTDMGPTDTGPTDTGTVGHGRAAIDSDGVPVISMRNVSKRFRRADGSVVNAIDGVSLDVHQGEFVVLLGPSGCGKTTLLRTIAGLEQADEGHIDIRSRTVFSAKDGIELAPERRGLSMIFQSYALWPHMTAFANVAYPLKSRREEKLSKDEIRERVEKVLALVGVAEVAGQYPNQMSGGQQQRVALARALVGGDDLVLFDEPLSNVDAKVRESLRRELLEMQRELGFAAVYVTHDQNEAMELAHRVAVMGSGKVRQLGAPHEIYLSPTSRYVANFVGISNELPGVVTAVSANGVGLAEGVGSAEAEVTTTLGTVRGVLGSSAVSVGDSVVASFRPEHGQVSLSDPGAGANTWQVDTERMLFLGPHTERVVTHGETRLRLTSPGLAGGHAGETVWLQVAPSAVRVLPVDDAVVDA